MFAGREKISSLQRSFTGYIRHTSEQVPCPGVLRQHKTCFISCDFCFVSVLLLLFFLAYQWSNDHGFVFVVGLFVLILILSLLFYLWGFCFVFWEGKRSKSRRWVGREMGMIWGERRGKSMITIHWMKTMWIDRFGCETASLSQGSYAKQPRFSGKDKKKGMLRVRHRVEKKKNNI